MVLIISIIYMVQDGDYMEDSRVFVIVNNARHNMDLHGLQ